MLKSLQDFDLAHYQFQAGEISRGEVLCAALRAQTVIMDFIAGVALDIKKDETDAAEARLAQSVSRT